MGALYAQGVAGPEANGAWSVLIKTLHRLHPGPITIDSWNDAFDRTHEEVLALYDAAIAVAE